MTLDHRSAVGDFQSLVSLRAQHFKASADGELSAADMDAYRQRVNKFKANCVGPGVRVAIFGRISSGAFVTAERASFLVQERSISFDWTEAQRLLHRADSVADQAAEWWPWEAVGTPERSRARKRREANDLERRPHVDRAYDLMTAVLSAVNQEHQRTSRQFAIETPEGEESDVRSGNYRAGIKVIQEDIERAEALLDTAAQQRAQLTYTTGMLIGAAIVGLACLLIGAAFYLTETAAADGVALLAGSLGAVVSVLQRMTTGRLRLDEHAGSSMLFRFGALRPAIGGLLGLAVMAIVASGLISALVVPSGQELPFYAAVGFLAGFNERFAQDVIASSAPVAGQPTGA